ncbi:Beta-glucosidase 1 [Sarracenia purpurea var. burkii]
MRMRRTTAVPPWVAATEFSGAWPETVRLNTEGLSRETFPNGFVFGTTYQVEGMADKDGHGPSNLDAFIKTPNNATGEIAVDQYHRYKDLYDYNFLSNATDTKS